MRYYAVLDAAAPGTARNVFLVDDSADPVAMVVFDHAARRWVQNLALIEFVAGESAADAAEISAADAAALAAGWGTALPSAEQVRALAEAAG